MPVETRAQRRAREQKEKQSTTRWDRPSTEPPLPPEEEDVCPICLEPFDDTLTYSRYACTHTYHDVCIAQWQNSSQQLTCPICKTRLRRHTNAWWVILLGVILVWSN